MNSLSRQGGPLPIDRRKTVDDLIYGVCALCGHDEGEHENDGDTHIAHGTMPKGVSSYHKFQSVVTPTAVVEEEPLAKAILCTDTRITLDGQPLESLAALESTAPYVTVVRNSVGLYCPALVEWDSSDGGEYKITRFGAQWGRKGLANKEAEGWAQKMKVEVR